MVGDRTDPPARRGNLRLLVYQRAYWPLFGGYAHHLRYRLRLLRSHGIEPWVLTQRVDGRPSAEIVDGVPVRRISVPKLLRQRQSTFEAALLPALMRYRSSYDLALLSSASVAGMLIRSVSRRPVIRESVIGENHAAKFGQGAFGRLREFLFRMADFAVAISPALERAYLDVEWPRERLRLIPRGVDNDAFKPPESPSDVDRLRQELDLSPRPSLLFVTVGAIQPRKGQLDLVEVWRLVAPSAPTAHLVLLGPVNDEGYDKAVKARVAELGLGGRVHFRGRSDRVAEYMRCADGFVFASRNEGCPNSVIEAMSSGLPIVAFDIEGIISFIVRNGEDGMVVSEGAREAMAREVLHLSGSAALRAEIGRAARETAVARFSLEKEAEAHAELYWDVFHAHQERKRS